MQTDSETGRERTSQTVRQGEGERRERENQTGRGIEEGERENQTGRGIEEGEREPDRERDRGGRERTRQGEG